jgi:hypothetical protein
MPFNDIKKNDLRKAIDEVDEAVNEVASSVPGGKDSRVFKKWRALQKRLSGD